MTVSGLKTFPMVVGLLVLSISSGIFISRTGRMIVFVFFGGVVISTTIVLLSLLTVDIEYWKLALMIFMAGIGVGSEDFRPTCMKLDRLVTTATWRDPLHLARQVLASVAVTGGIFPTHRMQSVQLLQAFPMALGKILPIYLQSVTEGMRFVFYGAIPFAIMIFVCGFFLKNYQRHRPEGKRPAADECADGTVIEVDLDVRTSKTPETEDVRKKEEV
ncbi:hypothetical protein BJ742DRAFT_853589 [Cladochytrium replicatum]|nr:hypothetical protein BJ742DRAFT_853589 [Cladochytrium replicatum]